MSTTTKVYKTGQALFNEGEPSISLFIVTKGAISIRKNKGKSFIEIAKIASHEIIGELSFFDRQPRSATAVAVMDVEVIEISFESLEKIYSSMPEYIKTIAATLAERLRKANELIRTLQKER